MAEFPGGLKSPHLVQPLLFLSHGFYSFSSGLSQLHLDQYALSRGMRSRHTLREASGKWVVDLGKWFSGYELSMRTAAGGKKFSPLSP